MANLLSIKYDKMIDDVDNADTMALPFIQAVALIKIAHELSRIADAYEEAHK